MAKLSEKFPFRELFETFLDEYKNCPTYWYTPKTRSLSLENVRVIKRILTIIFDEFLSHDWKPETQDKILKVLIEQGILEPYNPDSDLPTRTALIRIWKKLLETLGLLWVRNDVSVIITDAGLDVISNEDEDEAVSIVEGQIVRFQYPNPSVTGDYGAFFTGISPHLFLLQVLQACGYRVTTTEFDLFVNLARDQEDVNRVVRYIQHWRDLKQAEQEEILNFAREIPYKQVVNQELLFPEEDFPVGEKPMRFRRIEQNSSYQRSFFTFPSYLYQQDDEIKCLAEGQVDVLLKEQLDGFKVPIFPTLEDWFAYFGDPERKPSWFTFLSLEIEKANSKEEISPLVQDSKEYLSKEEAEEIQRREIEKDIETFYAKNLSTLEPGLHLYDNGRQFVTPIGRIDLLCQDAAGKFVVIEIKADEARDSSFGQILRYIGWVHRNIEEATNNVRGIILAGRFPEAARYSRIGLLREDYKEFIQFKEHGLGLSDT